nr:recombinase zinc beta ribbon domain-containing protein [Azospirillum sp. A1-3]
MLVCQKCGYSFTGHHHRAQWRYYRCCGTDRSRFDGQLRGTARLVAAEPLEAAVWREVCRLLEDPAHVLTEYQRRLATVQANPPQHELDMAERQISKLRCALDRLIDGYAEGFIARDEFEPRITALRQRIITLEAEAVALQTAAAQVRSLQLVIGKLSLFADMVRDRLEVADWATQRDLIRTLVKRIEVDDTTVRVIFRIEPGPDGEAEPPRHLPHCLTRHCPAPDVGRRLRLPLRQGGRRRVRTQPLPAGSPSAPAARGPVAGTRSPMKPGVCW